MNLARVFWISLLALGAALPLEAATATWDRNPELNVTGYRLSYGPQPGVHSSSIDAGNATTVEFFPPAGQRHYVVVQAYNSNGELGPKSAEVIFDQTPVNRPPVLTPPVNQSTPQNGVVSLALIATDPDGTAVTYAASGLPPGVTINTTSGIITGTATTAGTYTVTATASDGALNASATFTWTVTATAGTTTLLLSPTDTTINIDPNNYSSGAQLDTYTWPANRVSSAILLKFNLSQLPANATIQSATLQLSLVRADNATDPNYNVSLHRIVNRNPDVTRATGVTADGVLAWSPNTCCHGNLPMAQSDIAPASAVTAVNNTLGLKTWDALSIIQGWRSAPSTNYGLLLNADVTKGADRGRSFASMESTSVAQRPSLRIVYTVPVTDTTAPAVSVSAPANNATVSGIAASVSAAASDAVGVVGVQFRLDGANLGAEDTTAPYLISWNTTTATNGSHQLTAIARDAAGNVATSAAITVIVNNNDAPVLTQPAAQTTAEGTPVSLSLVASDPNGGALTFSATGLPAGLALNATSGLISGTPTFTSAGTYSVTATVSDGALSHSRTFAWTVTNTNRPPVLAQPATQTGAEGSASSLTLTASDPDGDALTFSATGLPAGLGINAASGVISGTPSYTSAGSYSVTTTVTAAAQSDSRTFSWTIADTNRSPVFPQPAGQTGAEGSAVSFTLAASDPDGHLLTFSATGLPEGLAMEATSGVISGWPSYTSAGVYSVTATVSDGVLTLSRTFVWTITDTNRPPVFTPPADQTSAADTDVTLQLSATDPDGAAVTYQATGLPPALTINAATGLISGRVIASSAGVHVVTVTVSDGVLATSFTFVWSVNDTDMPVRGDFDGDGRGDPATYRPLTGEWRVWPSTGNFVAANPIVWGISTDLPVSADYDGDGRTDIAVYRPSTGTWHVLLSSTNMQSSLDIQWGDPLDRPMPIDYDNDGRADLALPRFGGFEILLSGSNYTSSITVR